MTRSLAHLAHMIVLSLAAPLALAACGTTDAAPAPTAKSQKASTATDAELQQLCVDTFTRNRACTDVYIPALVDARAKYDKPAGIAAEVKTNRDGVIAQAKQEWATDSTDEAIATVCTRMAQQFTDEDRADADTVRGCLAQTECTAFVSCTMPIFEKHFAK
ncbi:MAG TPA: hypothetical protein VFQ53_16530 [Kofleriaceae bacterium]|nr:hypothetical protein [Kofleriaceae bacterium]